MFFRRCRQGGLEFYFQGNQACSLSLLPLAPLALLLADRREVPTSLRFLLGDVEREMFRRFPAAGRRLHWLGGRLAAKQALVGLLDPAGEGSGLWPRVILQAGSTGQPAALPLAGDQAMPWISLSHSGGFAVALASWNGPCGVDVQDVVPALARVQSRFCRMAEKKLLETTLPGLPWDQRLALLWSAKEAGKKAWTPERPGIFHLSLTAVTETSNGWRFVLENESHAGRLTVHVLLLEGHGLAWTEAVAGGV